MADWRDYPLPPEIEAFPTSPRLRVMEGLWSPELGNARDILVALPPSHGEPGRRFPVVYMHDGQNLFDPATSHAGHWELGATLAYHALDGLEAIVVAIPNIGERRLLEYSPFPDRAHGGGAGANYVGFLVDTLKPVIDDSFMTEAGRLHTAVGGSSMGGLASLYALFTRPDVFGVAGVLSPSLWFADRAMLSFVRRTPFPGGRIYLDIGTGEGDEAIADARALRDALIEKGYDPQCSLAYHEDEGAAHEESAWARRLRETLPFLLSAIPCPGDEGAIIDTPVTDVLA